MVFCRFPVFYPLGVKLNYGAAQYGRATYYADFLRRRATTHVVNYSQCLDVVTEHLYLISSCRQVRCGIHARFKKCCGHERMGETRGVVWGDQCMGYRYKILVGVLQPQKLTHLLHFFGN